MKPTEIRDLEASELQDKLKDARAELFNLRFQLATGQLDNTGRIGTGEEGHRAVADRAPCARAPRFRRGSFVRDGEGVHDRS